MKSSQNNHDLSPPVLHWVTKAVGIGVVIEGVHPLAGATSSTLHQIEAGHQGRSLKLVLRRFTNVEWLQEEPDLALHEAANLQKVWPAETPTPELVAYDPDGTHCDVPAILMTQLPGAVDLKPANLDAWLYQMAETLLPIHALEVGDHPWRYAPYNDIAKLEPPTWSSYPKLWERALEIVTGPGPETPACFIHRDYHPVNVLWQNSRLSGVVDWPNACRGPAGIDVAWCRGNLAGMYGVAVADRFLEAYQSLTGSASGYHPYWDLMVIIEALPGPPQVYPPWITFGIDLNETTMRKRDDAYLASVMARF